MSLAFCSKKIHCTNCHYEGKERIRGAGTGATFTLLLLLSLSFFYWPLFVLAGALMVWIVCTPACSICPSCGWEHPVSVDQYEAQKSLASRCPCMTGQACALRQ